MTVRFANIADQDQVLSLFDELRLFTNKRAPAKRKPKEIQASKNYFKEVVERNDTHIFVAEDKNKLIGLATFYLLPSIKHGTKRGHLEDFIVTDDYRGKGVGKSIFESIKNFCKKRKTSVIKLTSGRELSNAHHFYEKNGGHFTEKMYLFEL